VRERASHASIILSWPFAIARWASAIRFCTARIRGA
jgi:hypothetical protein